MREMQRKEFLLRHLILPGHMEESWTILEWIAANISTKVYLSLMSQFYPCNNVPEEINREISKNEYDGVLAKAEELGFENVYMQTHAFASTEHLIPDFSKDNPFSWEES